MLNPLSHWVNSHSFLPTKFILSTAERRGYAMTSTDLSPDTAPAYVPAAVLNSTPRVEPLTGAIGAEVSNVNLGVASRDSGLVAEIRTLLLKHKVLFFRDQDFTRAVHVAFARHFGDLEDH